MRLIAILLGATLVTSAVAQTYVDPDAQPKTQPAVVAEGLEIEIPRLVVSLGPLTLTIPQRFTIRIESVTAKR